MALIKKDKEIELMRQGGALLSRALQSAVDIAEPGIKMSELDDIATKVIIGGGGEPSFKGYTGGGSVPFPSTLCISRNDEIVHGVGGREIILEEGDIIGLDIGLWYEGLATDMAVTIPIGNISKERLDLLRVTRNSMLAGIEQIAPGKLISDIGDTVEDSLDTKKYGIIRSLVGHGVGHAVHEDPHIPNYRTKKFPAVKIKKGMCLAIEPMVTTGGHEIVTDEDGWTIRTEDGSDAAHFEVTVAVTENGYEVLTPQPKIRI